MIILTKTRADKIHDKRPLQESDGEPIIVSETPGANMSDLLTDFTIPSNIVTFELELKNMEVRKRLIYDLLEGRNKKFIVPVYQRDYAWKISNCKKLWEDILSLEESDHTHFLGTLVTIYIQGDKSMIIDGQQRLITVSLLLLAISNYLKSKTNKTSDEEALQEDILNDYLINKRCKYDAERIRLKPSKRDKTYFENLFDVPAHELPIAKQDSNIIQNYSFFYEKISGSEFLAQNIFDLFKKLEIVHIELDSKIDKPQLIFESINSTGVELTDGDLIRNYILMDLESEEQEYLYSKYWIEIERLCGNIAKFTRVFLIYTLGKEISEKQRAVYNEFKLYAERNLKRNNVKILEEMVKYAQIYSYLIVLSEHPNKKIRQHLNRIDYLEFTVCHSFLMDVFDLFEHKTINDETVLKVLNLIESYAFRKKLVDSSTQSLNKFFFGLAKEIKKEDNWQKNYFDIMAFTIKSKSGNLKFPTDDEFIQTLTYKDIYKLNKKNKYFLLENLENYNSPYQTDVQELTIEHIMPQKLTQEWKSALGNNYKEIHDKYLHTLGNLVLTAKNSNLSNKDFKDKQKIDFENSKLRLGYDLKDVKEWNEDSIVKRAKSLAEEAVEIWKYPKSNFTKPLEEERNLIYLSDSCKVTNTTPRTLIVEENESKVKTWKEVLIKICRILFKQSPTDFKTIINNSKIGKYFSNGEEDEKSKKLIRPLDFIPSYYVETNLSAEKIIGLCSQLCDELDFDKEKIGIQIELLENKG
ncbi:hypothetical protein B7O87_03015 [Cylindrospermopsis raciborskii CENA303]|uniref:DUF262 domain-containing protein n=1 Tax=Cylindrospermopsis raciborskii CENA303 TaxID=1170769 RepID=A0A1X4GBB0_9CYAN|nr:hypothetical protein B7O87_03015 [Cylindrospermopsis raciborskii CENA303]